MIGINDIGKNVSYEETSDYMTKICTELHNNLPDAEIYIQSILPIADISHSDEIIRLNRFYSSLCSEKGYTYVDLYPDFLTNGNINDGLFCDGVHINGKGYKIWIDKVKEYIYQ